MNTFDALYFLDLHGNAKKKETAPDGGKDENVFDIMQGVAISILIKNPKAKNKGVFHADLYGKRKDKYTACMETDIESIKWTSLEPAPSLHLFIPRDEDVAKRYESFWGIVDIFNTTGTPAPGIVTTHDQFAISFTNKETLNKVEKLLASSTEEDARSLFRLCSQNQWNYDTAKRELADGAYKEKAFQIAYRPFDTRWTVYDSNVAVHRRDRVMRHMLAGENLGLVTVRQARTGSTWQHCFVTKQIMEACYISNKGGEINYLYTLYRYDCTMGNVVCNENIQTEFRRWIDNRYGIKHTPEDILGCIYAILHSPMYRKNYADFLRIDFPRIPFPKQNDEFKRLATIGNLLINAHLLRANCTGKLGELNGEGASHQVEKTRYDQATERLYFNASEYFAPIPPQVFNFQIGGYQPLDKYLKSRKHRKLNLSDTETLSKVANAIAFTIAQMKEIDK